MPQTDRARVCDGAEYKINHFKPRVFCRACFSGQIPLFQSTENSAAGPLKEETKGLEGTKGRLPASGLRRERRQPVSELRGLLRGPGLSTPAPHLRLFKAGDGHEDVVEARCSSTAARIPSAPLLPQLIDGILRARRRERGREGAHTKQKHAKPQGRPRPQRLKPARPPRITWPGS